MSSLSFSHLSHHWDDGTPVLHDVTGALAPGLDAIVGANGAGKSTLLRILAGDLTPLSGSVERRGRVIHVPQDVALHGDATADAVMGLAPLRRALRAIEAGSTDVAHYERVGDDWDAEERARAWLVTLGLPADALDRRVSELSGGEITRVALAGALHARPDVLLLDEPTNNLDAAASAAVIDALRSRRGVTVVITHDRRLLDVVDRIGELRRGKLRWFGGALSAYEEAIAAERAGAEQKVREARSDVVRERRDLREHLDAQGRRNREGARKAAQAGMPRILAGAQKRRAQVSQGRVTGVHAARLEEAEHALADARDAAQADREIRVLLPETEVPPRKVVVDAPSVTVLGREVAVHVVGPERIGLTGPNGAGKTTMLQALRSHPGVHVPVGYLPQRLDVLDPDLSVLDNVRRAAPGAPPHQVRESLARFLFRGRSAEALASTLSGGERFRASIAAVLLARPAPRLLLLDEPTNNLDFASRAHLLEALAAYRGALVIASHDEDFLARLGLTRRWRLDPAAGEWSSSTTVSENR